MDDGIMVPLIFFAFLAAIIIVPQVLKSRDRQRMLDTMRVAYERGQQPPPELVAAMTQGRGADMQALDAISETNTDRDLRRGVVWTAVGVGLLLIGGFFYWGLYNTGGAPETFMSFGALAAIPLCVGLAFLALYAFGRRRPTV